MWKPASPIVIAGHPLTDQEAWWHEFRDELYGGAVASDLLTVLCNTMHSRALNEDPRHIARLAHAVLTYERAALDDAPARSACAPVAHGRAGRSEEAHLSSFPSQQC